MDDNNADLHDAESENGEENTSNATLNSINDNMKDLVTSIGKVLERQQSFMDRLDANSSPSTNARKRRASFSSSDESDTVSKRSKAYSEDDNLSLYAEEDLDYESDIKKLTESKKDKATGQKEGKTAELLKSLANNFEDDEATGENILQDLADMAKKRWGKKLTPEKIKSLLEEHKCPQNCTDMKAVRVNTEIWSQLDGHKRKTDLNYANMQQLIRKTAFASLNMSDMFLSGKVDDTKMSKLSINILAMLGHIHNQVSQVRRDNIKPVLKHEYKAICASSDELSSSQYLFGDDLAKKLRDAKDASKISHNVTYKGQQKDRYRTNNKHGVGSYNKRQQKPDFLWQGRSRYHARKKTNRETKSN